MKIAIIGFGAIGKERYRALEKMQEINDFKIDEILIYDPFIPASDIPEKTIACLTLETIEVSNPDWVFICTPHDITTLMLEKVIPWNTKILVEKPFCRTWKEALAIYNQVKDKNQIYVGFNYRFMDGVSSLITDCKSGLFGDIISIDMTLAHGGSPKDKTSWKMSPLRVGEGCLLDPGIHLLDLLLETDEKGGWIPEKGLYWNGFWNTGVQEEVRLLLRSTSHVIASLNISLVRWLSTFKIEINGTSGYGIVEGRGKSYGNQIYRRGKRWGWEKTGRTQRESEELVLSTDCSNSFYFELCALLLGVKYDLKPCTLEQALLTMDLYEDCRTVVE